MNGWINNVTIYVLGMIVVMFGALYFANREPKKKVKVTKEVKEKSVRKRK